MTWQEHTVKLSNVVNSDVVKKNVYDKLVVKVNNIDTSRFVLKTKYDTDKSYLEKKISDAEKKSPTINGILKKKDYNAKITEIESKIPSITGLATTAAALTTVENEIKKDYDAKKSDIDIENKYITTANYDRFTKDITSKIKSEGLINKSTISGFIGNADSSKKNINSNKSWIKSRTRQNNKITSIWIKLFLR